MRRAIPLALVVAFALLPAASVRAQSADQQVNQLLQQAQQAYEQYLDIGSAQNYIDQAITIVRQYGVTGGAAAMAYALRGVIHVWMSEEPQAVESFKSALTNDPNVQVPAAWGGPEIDAAIAKARRQLQSSAPPPPPTCPNGTVYQNGTCVPVAPTCPAGMTLQPNGTCGYPQPQCPAGMTLQANGTCGYPQPQCPAGMVLQPNGTCAAPAPVGCPPGMVMQANGTCGYPAPVGCPAGMVLQPNGSCAPPAPTVPMTRHTPVTEQLWNHPVPIYLEINPSLTVGGVYLFYKTPSDIQFQRTEMARSGPGYYVEIPCTILQPGAYDYYIAVLDPNGNPLAQEGSQDHPFHVNMVQVLSPGALYPTRPDGSTVNDCGEGGSGGDECPPGFPACHGVACERTCTFNDDCLSNETCLAGCCKVPGETSGPEGPSGGGGNVGIFFTLDAGVGFGLASGTAREPKWYTSPDHPDYGPLYGPDDQYDPYNVIPHSGRQQVPIAAGFALSGGVVRIGMGYFIIPELSISANFRLSFPFGDDFPWLVEGRLHYWFLSGPNHLFGAYVGGGAGLMVHSIAKVTFQQDSNSPTCDAVLGCDPPQKSYSPFYKVSGLGAIAFGADYMYMINSMFGIGAELGMDAMVPEFSFNFDLGLHMMLEF